MKGMDSRVKAHSRRPGLLLSARFFLGSSKYLGLYIHHPDLAFFRRQKWMISSRGGISTSNDSKNKFVLLFLWGGGGCRGILKLFVVRIGKAEAPSVPAQVRIPKENINIKHDSL